ncbi:hypothetical protein [Phaeobacter inhibens]|uniref:hypothetical protein n=1 Tax=Phaeobacter inhibens TaxID=221822 RepID=UPI00249374FA|nr:hypothetical protein [Phaeobacter inhibens]
MRSQAKRILDLELIHTHKLNLTELEWQTKEALADYSKALGDVPEKPGISSFLPTSWAAKRRLSKARKTAEAVVNRSSVHQKWVRQILLEIPKNVPEQVLFPELLWETCMGVAGRLDLDGAEDHETAAVTAPGKFAAGHICHRRLCA